MVVGQTMIAAALVMGGVASGACGAGVVRDWAAHPAVVELRDVPVIEAVGDLHADYDKAVALFAGVGLIREVPGKPEGVQWTGGKIVLVCTGDMIDKWTKSVEVLRLMRALQASARQAGGEVVVTLGNHEAEFLASGGKNKKAGEFEEELRAQKIDPAQLAAGEDAEGLGAWLRNLPVAAKVDDWFFCHAGNTFGLSLGALESSLESGIGKEGFGTFVVAEPNSILEARMHPVPWWLSTTPTPPTAEQKNMTGVERLRGNLTALGVKHLVIGHQPGKIEFGNGVERKAGEAFAYEGLLFLNDVGMSRGVQDGMGEVLKIMVEGKESVTTIDATGKKTILWQEK